MDREVDLDDFADIARQAAQRLGAEMDPSLPACVERALQKRFSLPSETLFDGDDIGTFIVTSATAGCRIYAEIAEKSIQPSFGYIERKLRSEMGIDEGMSPDHDNVIETIASTLTNGGTRS
ncbi:MAG: hypothetical protein H6905_11030 [Hyphomicrobiales bacterium]|nr:hypothetical protein [Hyphomicrobiales bacterium]